MTQMELPISDGKGTPKTLEQAILNGMIEGNRTGTFHTKAIKMHVKDFLAQKFQAASVRAYKVHYTDNDLIKMFKEITE